jgi:hypothetical protein
LTEFANLLLHLSSPEQMLDLALDQERCNSREGVQHHGRAHEHDKNIENAQRRIVSRFNDLAVADASEGDDRHVQRLQERDARAAQQEVSGDADHQNRHYREHRYQQPASYVPHNGLVKGKGGL